MLGPAASEANEPDPAGPIGINRANRPDDANRLRARSSRLVFLSWGGYKSFGPGLVAAGFVDAPACRLHDYIGPGQRREGGFRTRWARRSAPSPPGSRAPGDPRPWIGIFRRLPQRRQRGLPHLVHLSRFTYSAKTANFAHLWLCSRVFQGFRVRSLAGKVGVVCRVCASLDLFARFPR
jgi:hypothetical protein